MEQATVDQGGDQGEQQPQDDPLADLLDIAEVKVHGEEKEEEKDKDDEEEEEEYDPEEDEYLRNFINKVGISLGGQLGQPGPSGSKFVSLVSLFTGA